MIEESKSEMTLVAEITKLRQRIAELEKAEIDKKRIEETLQGVEERYKQLVDNASDIIYRTDANGSFTFFNSIAGKTTGYSERELMGKVYLELIRSDCRKEMERFYGRQLLKKISNTYCEFPILTKAGKEIWLGQNVQLILDGDRAAGFQAVARDITAHRRLEEEFKKSQERLELALKGGALGSWDVDLKAGHTIVNQRWLEMLGYSEDEVTDARELWRKSIHPDDYERVLQVGRDYRVGKTSEYEVEYRAITRHGHVVWLISKGAAVGRDADGSAFRMVGTVMDITERKQAEEKMVALNSELDEANRQLRLAYAWMRDNRDHLRDDLFKEEMGFLVDKDGLIEGVTEKVLQYTARPRNELIGTKIMDLLHDNYRDSLRMELSQAWRGMSRPIRLEMISPEEGFKVFEAKINRLSLKGNRLLLVMLR
jgi:PAS domain S-box-containing protein